MTKRCVPGSRHLAYAARNQTKKSSKSACSGQPPVRTEAEAIRKYCIRYANEMHPTVNIGGEEYAVKLD